MKVNDVFKKVRLELGFFLIIFLILPFNILAVTGYGEGNYGIGDYPSSGLTPIPQQNGNNNSASFNRDPPGCNKSVTLNVPDLFEIRANKSSATLFFSPPLGEYTSFYIAFSRKEGIWDYGTEYQQSYYPGVLRYTVYSLQPNTKYYVKIRTGNGCATGNWSEVISFVTSTTNKEKAFYKYSKINFLFKGVKTVANKMVMNKKAKITSEIAVIPTPTQINSTTKPIEIKIEPTAIPTVIVKNNNQPLKTEKQTTRKKFCILWWCF